MTLQQACAQAWRTTGLFALSLVLAAAPSPPALGARARKDKALCKKIQQAVRAGRTLDQIMAEFQVDAQQVMACAQPKGKGHKAKKPHPSKRAGSTSAPHRSIATVEKPAAHSGR